MNSSFREIFDKIYLINMPDRTDRLKRVGDELRRIGILIDGDVTIVPGRVVDDRGHFPSQAALGCFESHLSIFKDAQKNCYGRILILEDDLMISSRFRRIEEKLVTFIKNKDWDIILLGIFPYHNRTLADYYQDSILTNGFYDTVTFRKPPLIPSGTHFYAVSQSILDRLITFSQFVLEKRMTEGHEFKEDIKRGLDPAYIDTALYRFSVENNDVRYFLACPSLAWQRDDKNQNFFIRYKDGSTLQLGNIAKASLQRVFEHRFPSTFAHSPNASVLECFKQLVRSVSLRMPDLKKNNGNKGS